MSWSQHIEQSCLDKTDPCYRGLRSLCERSHTRTSSQTTPDGPATTRTVSSFQGCCVTFFIQALTHQQHHHQSSFQAQGGTKKNCSGKERGIKALRNQGSQTILKTLLKAVCQVSKAIYSMLPHGVFSSFKPENTFVRRISVKLKSSN